MGKEGLEGLVHRPEEPAILSAQKAKWRARRCLPAELADCNSSSGASPPSQLSTITLEDLGLLLEEGPASPELLSLEEISERYEPSCLVSTTSVPEQDTPKRWKQLEQWVADLQAEVVSLRGHKNYCERATLSLLQELRQVQASVQLQDSELRKLKQELQQAAGVPEKEALEFPSPQNQNKMQALDKRLVEVREALTQIRRKQALQDSERKGTKQESNLRLTKLARKLEQEEQNREEACSALKRSQEEASQKVDQEVARLQAQVTKLGEEMSLRFLKREAKLCGFLQKSFLALEKRMTASESTRLKVESSLREELESRWRNLQELAEERLQALRGQCKQEECYLLEQCRGLDRAVVQLTKFFVYSLAFLNHVLLAEQKAQDTKGHLEESQAGELAAYLQENMEAMQLASEQARQETQSALELLQEKRQALEGSVAELVRQVGDLNDHFLALSWRLDLQEKTLTQKLCEAKSEREGAERRSMEGLAWCRKEARAYLREVRETVDSLPRQIEAVSDRCVLHKSDSDLKISAEGKAREFQVEAVRQELAALLSSVQLLREGNPGRKIAEIQGKLATFQNQIIKLENSIQDNKTIQNLKFNSQIKMRMEEMATLKECLEGPWALTLDSRKVLVSLVRQQFIKNVASGELVPVNLWGVYQAVRWLQWKAVLMNQVAKWRPRTVLERSLGQEPAHQLPVLPLFQK
ncbi:PREDICTED: coiled-coil domain-containing protein 154 [Myotis davidii]|uniref:coiled-coil domain-containing protein 154 n=1 Tax=Myotis davidii TaxID=225400 RepID=UPI0003EBF1F5|nr:PREDICTED: coiled-coil domain-containing protein 154 [Myotis davidii]